VFAAVLAWAAWAALVQPFLIACMLLSFVGATERQAVQADWTARLTDLSEPFRHMGAQADVWMPSGLRMPGRT
jgi:hypothetical protein